MCGISLIIDSKNDNYYGIRNRIYKMSKCLTHRGPDCNGIYINESNQIAIGHERLSIIDPQSGQQPIEYEDKYILSVNGEIFNYRELIKEHNLNSDYTFTTKSDCEVIIPLWIKFKTNMFNMLRGQFAFVLYDIQNKKIIISRDHIGICPLYYCYSNNNDTFYLASESKSIHKKTTKVFNFPPRNYMIINLDNMFFNIDDENNTINLYNDTLIQEWYENAWLDNYNINTLPNSIFNENILFDLLHKSVDLRLMSDVKWGVLLSGGLDSSLICSIASKLMKKKDPNFVITTFSIGLKNSPDLKYARTVAKYLNTNHYEFTYTLDQGNDVLESVIYHIETYDITTIRASVPMFILARKIKSLGFSMVLSGEGADELFGGYLYFHQAPNKTEFFKETCDKILQLHLFDCLRANKSMAAWGIEVRVPFLDKEVVNYVMNLDPEYKMIKKKENSMEKYILRHCFDKKDYLPNEILWRQKEQFSDGVGYGWIDFLKSISEKIYGEYNLESYVCNIFPNPPISYESLMYRMIFDKHFYSSLHSTIQWSPTIACSTKRALSWAKEFTYQGEFGDASGRYVSIHNKNIN